MNGMEMMLKSLGLNPDEIKQSVVVFQKTVTEAITEVRANQQRIEEKLDIIITKLDNHAKVVSYVDFPPVGQTPYQIGKGIEDSHNNPPNIPVERQLMEIDLNAEGSQL